MCSVQIDRTMMSRWAAGMFIVMFGLVGCGSDKPGEADDAAAAAGAQSESEPAAEVETEAEAMASVGQELRTWKIPNVPSAVEAYYAPDNLHVIAQTADDAALKVEGRATGHLTYTFTDQGEDIKRINDRGQDACSYFFPDQTRREWSDSNDYPKGAELYSSDLDGGNVKRLTDNEVYEAEVSVSPNGEWIVFGRQTDGKMDLWRMRPDGSDEQQITFTDDWEEGAPFYLPDNETIMMRAWKRSEKGKIRPTPMTVFTIKHDGTELTERTFDRDMNWAPYPAPDGRHYVFVRIVDGKNWEIFLGDLAGGEPVRLTYSDTFDGFPSLSPDGTKMLFARSEGERFMSSLATYVMDVSSLNLGPENYTGVPDIVPPES